MKQGTSRKKRSVIIALLVIAFLLLALLFGKNMINSLQSTTSPLHAKLQAIYETIPTQSGKANFLIQSHHLTQNVDPELIDLDSQIITCSPTVDSLLSTHPHVDASCVGGESILRTTKGMALSGQCCGTLMDTKDIHANRAKLQAYKNMPQIVLDPYKTPIAEAKYWIDYDRATTLTPVEQNVFQKAYRLSQEKPCCCHCWHYFMDEGIAKKMIQDRTFQAQQIADFWDASTICGV